MLYLLNHLEKVDDYLGGVSSKGKTLTHFFIYMSVNDEGNDIDVNFNIDGTMNYEIYDGRNIFGRAIDVL